MTSPGLISVIIPCYNYGHYLLECLSSVVNQTYLNWEAIIVDDGSTDDTPQVAPQVVALAPDRINYHRTNNQGVSKARNHALSLARGEFIFPLDADDTIHPEALGELVTAISKSPEFGIAYSSVSIQGAIPGQERSWLPGPNSEGLLTFQNYIPISSLWRKSLFEMGVCYRDMFFEDWDLWLQIIAKGFKANYVPRELFNYRKHPSGRDSRNRYFYFPALAQQIRGNPTLYPEQLQNMPDKILMNAPGSFQKPTIVLLPDTSSTEFSNFNGPLEAVAKEFVGRGHLVVTMGSYLSNPVKTPGVFSLEVGHGHSADNICFNMGRIGAELIVLSEYPEEMSHRFREIENIYSIFNIAGKVDTFADRSISREQNSWKSVNGFESFGSLPSFADFVLGSFEQCKMERTAKFRSDFEHLRHLGQPSSPFSGGRRSDPAITVAIPLRNVDYKRLERCLQSIRETESPEQTPIIISDFGSSSRFIPEMEELANRYGATIVRSKTRAAWSRSRALNAAIRACSTPWILMTDVDMIFSPELIPMWREYRSLLGDRHMYLGQCIKLPPLGTLATPWNSNNYVDISTRGRLFDTFGQGGCQILPVQWLHSVTGFNEVYKVWGLEDNDLSFRAALEGITAVWMQPGKLLHQWHIKAVSSAARNTNRLEYEDVVRRARVVVNGQDWGRCTPDEIKEYDALGPAEFVPSPEYSTAKEIEQAILNTNNLIEQIDILNRWGYHALHYQQDESASETFEDVLTLDPNNTTAMCGLAQTMMLRRQYSTAGHFAARVLKIDPQNQLATEILAHCVPLTLQV